MYAGSLLRDFVISLDDLEIEAQKKKKRKKKKQCLSTEYYFMFLSIHLYLYIQSNKCSSLVRCTPLRKIAVLTHVRTGKSLETGVRVCLCTFCKHQLNANLGTDH